MRASVSGWRICREMLTKQTLKCGSCVICQRMRTDWLLVTESSFFFSYRMRVEIINRYEPCQDSSDSRFKDRRAALEFLWQAQSTFAFSRFPNHFTDTVTDIRQWSTVTMFQEWTDSDRLSILWVAVPTQCCFNWAKVSPEIVERHTCFWHFLTFMFGWT